MSEADIMLGSNITIGKITLDPGAIRGAGGWRNPYLYMQMNIALNPTQAITEQRALIRLAATLHLNENIDPTNYFAFPCVLEFVNGLPHRTSVGTTPSEFQAFLHCNLTHEHIIQLDEFRRQSGASLYIHFEPTIVRWDALPTPSIASGMGSVSLGQQANFSYLWSATVSKLRLDLAEMKWAEEIFPKIGYDKYRLVEVSLPMSATLVPDQAVEYFKQAKVFYDALNHIACLNHCRLALEEIKHHLHVQQHHLGIAVSLVLGWPTQPTNLTEQAKFLEDIWHGLYVMANAASHTPSNQGLFPADSRATFLTLAVLLEYLARLQ